MKFPLAANVFPVIQLTPAQCAEFAHAADTVVADAIAEYDTFRCQHRRKLSMQQWKLLKKRGNVTVYSERFVRPEPPHTPATPVSTGSSESHAVHAGEHTTASRSTHSSVGSSHSSGHFSGHDPEHHPLPRLLALGSVPGTIEDMVYGMSAPTPAHTMIKAAYTKDEVLDAKVLYEITRPSLDDPLRFLGLKWLIKGHSSAIGALVRLRDIVYIESSGIKTQADGSRIGYFVLHSVDVPECRPLDELSIVRGRTSSCFLFTQQDDRVDVFMTSYVELNGHVTDAIAVRTAANSLLGVARAGECAHSRKMGWAVTKRLRYAPLSASPTAAPAATHLTHSGDHHHHHQEDAHRHSGNHHHHSSHHHHHDSHHCSLCAKSFGLFHSAVTCYFCASRVCHKCSEHRTLMLPSSPATTPPAVHSGKLVVRMTINACSRCSSIQSQDAEVVARQEILAGEYGSVPPEFTSEAESARSSDPVDEAQVAVLGPRDAVSAPEADDASVPVATAVDTVKDASLDDIGATLLLHADAPSDTAKDTTCSGYRAARAISLSTATTTSSALSAEDLCELVDKLAHPSADDPAAAFAAPLPVLRDGRERKDSVIELSRDDGEWVRSASVPAQVEGSYCSSSRSSSSSNSDLYTRITELHQTAETLYQYTRRTTETVLGAGAVVVIPPPLPPSRRMSATVEHV